MPTLKEKSDRRKAMLISIGIHGALVVLFIFMVAWREPYPPMPDYGIELNIGLEQEGSGNIQPRTPPRETPVKEETPAEESTPPQPEKVIEEKVENKIVEEQQQEEVVDSKDEASPIPTEPVEKPKAVEKKVEEKPETKKVEPTVESTPKEKPTPAPEEKKVVDTKALYPGTANQGESKNKVGDAGEPEGKTDARALYGKKGGGDGGPSLEIANWKWDQVPRPNDTSNQSGRIVFQIKVDQNGEITGYRVLETAVSADVLQLYKREIEKLTFSLKSNNSFAPPETTGTITFILRSK